MFVQSLSQSITKFAHELWMLIEFHAIVDNWEAIIHVHFILKENEVLGIYYVPKPCHWMDESIIATKWT
jgi:hypothetical protein